MVNCGRCGKPIHNPGEALCKSCKKTISSEHGKHIDKENKQRERTEQMYDSMSNPGGSDESDKYDVDFWGLGDKHRKYKKKGRRR